MPKRTPGRPAISDRDRVEFGDWQTPDALAEEVLGALSPLQWEPSTVLEPTCGVGAFLRAANRRFPRARLVGFDIAEQYVKIARSRLRGTDKDINVADFFVTDWERVVGDLREPMLVVGNPPWVTSSALGAIDARNMPLKSNFKSHAGLDAKTGKANFDVSEWMLIRLLDSLAGRRFTLAMLCKASVARRVMEYIAGRGWQLEGEVRTIDANEHFGASVDAVLLRLDPRTSSSGRRSVTWAVHSSIRSTKPDHVMGVVDGRLVSDVRAYDRTRDLEGASTLDWRSGIKHDCAKIMELELDGASMFNGLGERVEVEDPYVFPLLKGSDVANQRLEPRRAVIVTQRGLGEDTRALQARAPMLWRYLQRHRAFFEARKSSIYRGQPPFAMFGIGDYSFAPCKVAICGLYKKLSFAVVTAHAGKPVMVDDTVYFLPCRTKAQGREHAKNLNGERAREFFEARLFWDMKRPISKSLLGALSLDKLLAMA